MVTVHLNGLNFRVSKNTLTMKYLLFASLLIMFTSCSKEGIFPDASKDIRHDTAQVTVYRDTVPNPGFWWTCPNHTKHDSTIIFSYNTKDTTYNDYHIPHVGQVTLIWDYNYLTQDIRYYYNVNSIKHQLK